MVFRACLEHPEIDVVGINDLCPADYLAYMLKYDTMHGRCKADIESRENALVVNGQVIPVFSERDPANLKWGKLGAEYIVESTGLFLTKEKLPATSPPAQRRSSCPRRARTTPRCSSWA